MKPEQFIREFEPKFDEWWEENYMNVSADRTEAFDIYSLGLKHQQAKVEELQKQLSEYIFVAETLDEMYVKEVKSSEELQEEFAEDERFLKEQIKDKDLKISNLEYLQGMDKELIQSLQSKSEKLQKRVQVLIQKYKDEDRELKLIDEWEQSQVYGLVVSELEQALKGEG